MEWDGIKGKIRENWMCRRKRDSRATGSKSERSTPLSQSTNGDEVNRCVRSMKAVFEDEDHGSVSRGDTKPNSPPGKGREHATVRSFDGNSSRRIIVPKQATIANNM